jgi:HAD superfamily hydrolase (TIGR01457 family)
MIADRYDAFLFDLDGTLFRGSEPIPGADAAVATLRAVGKRLCFVTNNSSATPEEAVEKLEAVGIVADVGEVETSALVTAAVLADRGVARVFLVGEEGLRSALLARGIEVLMGPLSERADAVVVGWDRTADWDKLKTASLLLQRGAAFVASNADASFPAPGGERWPGAGALLAALETTTGIAPEVIGKPAAPILDAAIARAGGGTPLVIGDRVETDILGAVRRGWDSMLVLSGVGTRDELRAQGIAATYVVDDVTALVER